MNCKSVSASLSEQLDGELSPRESVALEAHLAHCPACAEQARSLRAAASELQALPRLHPPEAIAARVLSRVEAETRGPGLRVLYRSAWARRPLLLPSLVPAALVLVLTLGCALVLSGGPEELPAPLARTVGEWNTAPVPSGASLMAASAVALPRRLDDALGGPDVLDHMVEGSLFVESVVRSDGSVAAVNVLAGNQELAWPLRTALWGESFEPARYRGRPVAVSVYRLISRVEVRAPIT